MQRSIHKLSWAIEVGDLVRDDPVHRRSDRLNHCTRCRVDHANDGATIKLQEHADDQNDPPLWDARAVHDSTLPWPQSPLPDQCSQFLARPHERLGSVPARGTSD